MSRAREPRASTAVIADDEALARRRILELLDERATVRVVGTCSTGPATLNTVRTTRPDLLFLDVQMPGLDGFEVLARLEPDDRPVVVFSTAYDEYALAAFEVNAVDYLLKPFADERFEEAVTRAERAIGGDRTRELHDGLRRLVRHVASEAGGGLAAGEGSAAPLRHFGVPDGDRHLVVAASSVDWIEADGDYVRLHVGGRVHLLRRTMKSLEGRLDASRFLRVHRSVIARVDRVRHVRSNAHGDYTLLLDGGERLPVGRRYRDAVLERLGLR